MSRATLGGSRRSFVGLLVFFVFAATLVPANAAPGGNKGGGKCNPRKTSCSGSTTDNVAPSVTISAPTSGATVSGTITVSGSASDDASVGKVDVSVDGGTWKLASGTSSWTSSLDTTTFGDGSHSIAARATDASGNSATASVAVTFDNVPDADTTAPSVSISSPTAGATVGGTISVAGASSDGSGVAKVEVKVDSGSFNTASGTTSWTSSLDTTAYADGSHTITARAVDPSGNATTTSVTVTFANTSTGPSPSPSPTSSPSSNYMVTPEGTIIEVNSAGSWTAEQIYQMLKENGLDSTIGPTLKVKVQDTTASQVVTSASMSGGRYTSFKATMYLKGVSSSFASRPNSTLSHEYGHVWSLYHLYMSQNGDWTSYLEARGILNDPRLDSTYNWSRHEIIADDYRLLFGSALAISERPTHLNSDLPDPRDVPGLRTFLQSYWTTYH